MNKRIPLSVPAIGPEEIEAVTRVLESKWLTMGPVTAEFEATFAERMRVKHAIAVSSCTAALHLANACLGIGPGDEVICPDLTFVASANATRYTGADVVLADVTSADDLTISVADVERKISKRTKAITVVHYAGFPCDMPAILDIAERHEIAVIEDCAHAPLSWCKFPDGTRRPLGSLGDIGCFSFFSNKNMTTGEGGMVTTNNDHFAEKVRRLRSHGMTTSTFDRDRNHASSYDVEALGWNYRLDEIRSALGLCQLRKLDFLNNRRREVYSWYAEELSPHPEIRLPFLDRDLADSACHILPVIVPAPSHEIKKYMLDQGVQTSKHYEPISSFTAYAGVPPGLAAFSADQLMTLPLGPHLDRNDVASIVTFLAAACEANGSPLLVSSTASNNAH
jgi:dTDP-4-amino-4,6-dideoxygalactose transaminase